jgi:hypothetical protein
VPVFLVRLRWALRRLDRTWWLWLPFVAMLAALGLAIRMPHLLATPSLWAEDTDRFIEGFLQGGLASIWQPVHGAGYHVLFERLVAALLLVVPLKYAEILFHVFSLLVIWFAFAVVWRCLPTRSFYLRVLACLAILWVPIEPTSIYLTLVNTQWILAPATMLLIVTDHVPRSRHKALWCAALFVLGMTGPFVFLATPLVALRMLVYRDARREKLFYASIVAPIALQIVTLLRNFGTRPDLGTSKVFGTWYQGIVGNTLLHELHGWLGVVLFAALLLAIAWHLVKGEKRERVFIGFALLAIAAINFAAGFYSYRNMPELTGPFGAGERYFILPFLLVAFFMLGAARGWLKPLAAVAVLLVCLVNAQPIASGPGGRGPNYWRSQIEASRFFGSVEILTRPIWIAPAEWKLPVGNAMPKFAPVEKPLTGKDVEIVGMSASEKAPRLLHFDRALQGKDLLGDTWNSLTPLGLHNPSQEAPHERDWYASGAMVSAAADGAREVTIAAAPENELYYMFGGVQSGGILTLSFEARADAPITLSPHVTDYRQGTSYLAPLGPEWRTFAFDYPLKKDTARAGVYVSWHSGATGKVQLRNVRATLDERHFMLLKLPPECAAHRDAAISYTALNAAGLHRLDASSVRDRYREWYALHRYVGGWPEKNVLFALPIQDVQWIKLSVTPPLDVRDLTLRCY